MPEGQLNLEELLAELGFDTPGPLDAALAVLREQGVISARPKTFISEGKKSRVREALQARFVAHCADPEFFGGTFKEGLFYGGGLSLLGEQALANGVVIVFSFTVTFLLFKVLKATIGIRVSAETEEMGLDLREHSETAYHAAGQTMERV